jgi:hypothetical protein
MRDRRETQIVQFRLRISGWCEGRRLSDKESDRNLAVHNIDDTEQEAQSRCHWGTAAGVVLCGVAHLKSPKKISSKIPYLVLSCLLMCCVV